MVGEQLVWGFSIWSGRTTEPAVVPMVFPFAWPFVGLVLWFAGVVLTHRDPNPYRRKLWLMLVYSSSLSVAILPWIQFFQAVRQT